MYLGVIDDLLNIAEPTLRRFEALTSRERIQVIPSKTASKKNEKTSPTIPHFHE